ncbi:LuxR C-terminal-related transcriptional regulator [Comamonas composti]|uniref:LuxR C-terminal-related transcriptional regulator n=1 Tax=Comamonas composti TaxID=408558 RepID=UPI00040DC475|nr:LuxR C-terminal-related transcriptional regulator [Comamonas composti]
MPALSSPSADTLACVALEGKLHPPLPALDHVPRAKLRRLLEQTPGWRLLLLRAPAGYGKTTLMGQLFAHLQKAGRMSCHWLTLDPRDDDPLHLLAHLEACISHAPDGLGAQPRSHLPDLGSWLNAVGRLPGQRVLFLDEFEALQKPASVQLIHQLLRFAPPNLRVVLSTRPSVHLALQRMKAGGGLVEWSARQLRFDEEETQALLQGEARRDAQRPSPSQAPAGWHRLMAERCEGWPAALRLSLLALAHGEAVRFEDLPQDGSCDLAEYLTSEVFERQTEEVRAFLLDTSVLRNLVPALCDVLAAREDSARLLQSLARELQLLTPFSQGTGDSWRYHSLLKDFLRKRLDILHPGRAAGLHRRAALWLQQQGRLIEAIDHALECADPAFAAAMMEGAARPLVRSGHLATLQQWIARLPAHIADEHPGIVWAAGRAHTYFHQIAEARVRLGQLRTLAARRDFDRLTWEDYLALEALIPAAADDVAQTMEITARNLPLVSGDYALGNIFNVRAHGEIALNHFDQALDLLDQADLHNRRACNLFGLSATLGLRAAIWSSRGELRQAMACYADAGSSAGAAIGATRHEHAALGSGLYCELLYESNRLDELQALLALHAPHEDDYLATDLVIGAYLAAARLQFARSDEAGAQAILQEALARSLQRRFRRLEFACRWEMVRLACLAGRLEQAAALVPADMQREAGFHFATDTEACDITWLRLELRRGQALHALPEIERQLAQARTTQRGWRALKLEVLRGCALDALGRQADAREALGAALRKGFEQGFVRSLADEGQPLLKHVQAWLAGRQAMPTGLPREYLEQLLAAAGQPPQDAPPLAAPAPAPLVCEDFSERELQLLQALARGAQNKEMAAQLGLSENTVKWYLKRLYLKLDARNRAQAIAQARRLNLVDDA